MTGEIIKRYADIAREHLSRDYGLVYLDCNHMLAIEATVTAMQRERDEAREMLGEAVGVLRQSSSALSASYQQAQCEWTNRDKAADRHDRTVIDFRNAVSTFLARYEGGRS